MISTSRSYHSYHNYDSCGNLASGARRDAYRAWAPRLRVPTLSRCQEPVWETAEAGDRRRGWAESRKNPNGISSSSPRLRGPRYPGGGVKIIFNPNGGCFLIQNFDMRKIRDFFDYLISHLKSRLNWLGSSACNKLLVFVFSSNSACARKRPTVSASNPRVAVKRRLLRNMALKPN